MCWRRGFHLIAALRRTASRWKRRKIANKGYQIPSINWNYATDDNRRLRRPAESKLAPKHWSYVAVVNIYCHFGEEFALDVVSIFSRNRNQVFTVQNVSVHIRRTASATTRHTVQLATNSDNNKTTSKYIQCELKLQYTWLFIITSANVDRPRPIFKTLSLSNSRENSLCNYCRVFHFTLTMLLHYLAKFKNVK